MANPGIIERPEVNDGQTGNGPHFIVTVFNNDVNTYDEVVEILLEATACSLDEAQIETWEVDHLGKSVVHHGRQDECDAAASVIRQIGIKVEVSEE